VVAEETQGEIQHVGEDRVIKKLILALMLLGSFVSADIFEKGRSNVGVSLGAGSSYGNTYTLVGVSGNYFLVNNLALGMAYRGWFGASPTQNELSLGANYYLPISEKFRPYLGAFARETFISDHDDFSSYGARAGVAITMSSNSYVSVGYAYEEYSNCVEILNRSKSCSSSYPEVVFALSF
jgi:hypothetical protein